MADKLLLIWSSHRATEQEAHFLADNMNEGLGKDDAVSVLEITRDWFAIVGNQVAKDWYAKLKAELDKQYGSTKTPDHGSKQTHTEGNRGKAETAKE